jgi:non-homologous end joining protein Ku
VTHPQRFFDTPYYVTPDDPVGVQAFAVIRDAKIDSSNFGFTI